VASRGDYQNGEELKKVNRLVDKIEEKRRGDPSYTIDKVGDIIGIRLVYIHPSGVEEHDDESGYRALHVIVTLRSPVELRNIKCEIQLITMLQEAWGFKTHGPIYEKRKYLEEEYKMHANLTMSHLINFI